MRQLGSSKREIFSWLDRYKAHLLIFFNRLVDRLVDRSCALFFRLCRDSFPSSLGTVLLEAPEVGVRPPALNAAVGDAHVHDLKDFSCFPLLGLVIGVIQRFLVELLGAELIPGIGFHEAVNLPGSCILLHVFLLLPLPGSGILLHVFLLLHDGTVLGQDINDTTLRTVSQAIRSNIKPPIYPSISEQTYGKRKVVYVKFDGTQKPYLAYNIPRIRIADEDSVMEQPLYEEMLRQRESISYSWESQRSKYKVSDIDKQVFDKVKLMLHGKDAQDVEKDLAESRVSKNTLDKIEKLNKDIADIALEQLKTETVVKEFLKRLTHLKIEQDKKAEELRLKTLNICI